MKKWIILVYCFLFLIAVNTSYFWADSFFYVLIGFALYFILGIILLVLLILASVRKFRNKWLNIHLAITLFTMVFIYFFPRGVIPYEKLIYGEPVFVAGREGVANCYTSLKLYDNNIFKYKSVCFGDYSTVGTYTIKGDTIWLKNHNGDIDKTEVGDYILIESERVSFYSIDSLKPIYFFEDIIINKLK